MDGEGTPMASREYTWDQQSDFDDWRGEINEQGWFLDARTAPRQQADGSFVYTFVQLVPGHAEPNMERTSETQTHDEGDEQ